jgi:minor extracellular serine protease Vpr
MRFTTNRLRIFVAVTAAALLTGSSSASLSVSAPASRVPLSTRASRQQSSELNSQSLAQSLANSTDTVTAIFELEGDSVVTHENSLRSSQESSSRVEVSSAESKGYDATLMSAQRDFETKALAISPDIHVATELRKLVNAVSVTGPGYQIARLATLPGVRNFQLSRRYHALLDRSVPLINAPTLWTKLGGSAVAGKGIKVAILDSGIDLTNPLFSDAGFVAPPGYPMGVSGFTNNKVISARVFSANSSDTPQDLLGHGTSVAGIVAGDLNTATPLGPVSGVAPAAFLGNYRVLDANGNGDEDLIASGLEAAFADGFDIANISFGAPATSTPGVLDDAVEVAASSGMTVVVAAGDDGANGQMTIESPGTALNAITVAASSNAHVIGPSVGVTGPGSVPSLLAAFESVPGASCGPPQTFPIGPATLFDESLLDGQKLGCKLSKLPLGSLTGKIALIEWGNCTAEQKIDNAATAGASAVIIYNEDISLSPQGGDNLIQLDATGTTIPSVFIERTNGLALKSWVDANPGATVRISGPAEFAQAPDVLAPFSGLGPTIQGTLKPDIAAPGQNIYSGAIRICNPAGVSDPSGFLMVSGTSQAAAHVTGGAALIAQLHPTWTVSQIKSALVNSTATNVIASTGSTTTAGVLSVGAGRVDLARASTVNATLAPSSLSFGIHKLNSIGHSVSLVQTLNITSVAAGATTFNISVNAPATAGVTVSLSAKSLSVPAGGTEQIQLTIAAKKNAQRGNFSGLLTVSSSASQALRVPFWVRF